MALLADKELTDYLEPSLAASPKKKKNFEFFFDRHEQQDAAFKSTFENFEKCIYIPPNSKTIL